MRCTRIVQACLHQPLHTPYTSVPQTGVRLPRWVGESSLSALLLSSFYFAPTCVIFLGKRPTRVCYHKSHKGFQWRQQTREFNKKCGCRLMSQMKRMWVLTVTAWANILKNNFKQIVFMRDQQYFSQGTVFTLILYHGCGQIMCTSW